MGPGFVIFILIALLAVAIVVFGLFATQRSFVVLVFSAIVAFLACGLALYAWTESHSLPWTIGYATLVVLSIASSLRQFTRQAE